jgi:peptidyl-prolyl cis-trans isomerase C
MEPGYGTAVGVGDRGTASGDQATATTVASVEPLAARVNGEPIFEHEYERAVLRYEVALQALGLDSADHGDYRRSVLAQAIDRLLIAQAARARGLHLDLHELQNAFDETVQAAGGRSGFDEWLQANDYSEAEFKQELQAQLLAGKVQVEILSMVGSAAEQVHARHVLVTTREQAEAIKAQLVSGADFATIALARSLDRSTRVNGGDLGWFPRGLLIMPEIETAAFELMPGERSGIVETSLGFHIVETLERDTQRELSPEAALAVRQAAVESWLSELRAAADIERFVP